MKTLTNVKIPNNMVTSPTIGCIFLSGIFFTVRTARGAERIAPIKRESKRNKKPKLKVISG